MSQRGRLLRFSQLFIFTILNLIDAEVLIKIRVATTIVYEMLKTYKQRKPIRRVKVFGTFLPWASWKNR